MIPIFPLSLVVYPGARYPLHIFEERYKNMVKYSMKLGEPFGILIFDKDNLGRIGTKVTVESVTKNYPDGSFDIIVKGEDRFVLKTLKENEIGYYEAEVDHYDDLIKGTYSELEEETLNLFNEVVEKAGVKLDENYFTNLETSEIKSFKLAEKVGLTLEQQQTLITLRNEGERLFMLQEHLKNLSVELDNRADAKILIERNGYIN
ncbi:MAG: hypothetical protein B6D45_12185 [Ignavibacteriales bacterium UTCHB3]|nr:MAG: hypothetical protein B6D45_12185 [Ignavibacteriales bacterium UTCHB3]